MNKTKITALITALLLVVSTLSAFAAEPVSTLYTTVKGEQEGESWQVSISGTSAQKPGTVVMMNLLYPGVKLTELGTTAGLKSGSAYTDMTSVAEDGTFSFTIPFKENDVGGVYTAYVVIPGDIEPIELEIPCMNYTRRVVTLANAQTGTMEELRDSLILGIGDLNALSSRSYTGYDDPRREYVSQYIIDARDEWDASDVNSEKLAELERIIGDVVTALDTIMELSADDREGIDVKLANELADVENGGDGIMMLDLDVLASYGALTDSEKEAAVVAMEGYKNTLVLPENVTEALSKSVEAVKVPEKKPISSEPQNSGSGGGGGGSSTKGFGASKDFVEQNQPTVLPEAKDEFTDLGSVAWAKDAINTLAARDILAGVGNGEFRPTDTLTRAQFAQMVVKAFDIPLFTEKTMPFTDVNYGDWYNEAIQILYHRNIVKGVSATEFGVNDPISRQDMAVIINRTMAHLSMIMTQGEDVTFTDEADIADYALSSVKMLAKTGVINGKSDGAFAPKDTATRAEAAVIIYRIMYAMKLL